MLTKKPTSLAKGGADPKTPLDPLQKRERGREREERVRGAAGVGGRGLGVAMHRCITLSSAQR